MFQKTNSEIEQAKEDERNFTRIAEDCDKLIKNTEKELFNYKKDKIKLKEQVLKILQDNNNVHTELKNLKISPLNEKHEQLTNDAIEKLKTQIRNLREERDFISNLWKIAKDTITNLESEISNYRGQIQKPSSYLTTVHFLENTIKNIRNELNKQVERNKTTELRLKSYEIQFEETKNNENLLDHLKKKLTIMMCSNQDLEKSLATAKQVIGERFVREKEALEKVQEALQIAERAIAEKDDALNREVIIREECDHLATTIGQVMEEAAVKVENDIEKLKLQYSEELEQIKQERLEALDLLEKQKKITQFAEVRYKTLENKLKEVQQSNIALDTDLHVASQDIVGLELKLKAIESLTDTDKKTTQLSQDRDKEIEQYICCNQQLKEKWKAAVEDVTHKLENEVKLLQNENTILKSENQALRLKLFQYE